MKWVLIIIMFSTAGSGMTSIKVDSKETCQEVENSLPKMLGRTYKVLCVEDK